MCQIRLLYVITKLELGGAQRQLLSLLARLDKEQFKIFLFTADKGLLFDEFLSVDKVILKRSKYLERPINPLKDFLALIEIYRFIKKNNINIVHTHSSKAGILGRVAAKLSNMRFLFPWTKKPHLEGGKIVYSGLENTGGSLFLKRNGGNDPLVIVQRSVIIHTVHGWSFNDYQPFFVRWIFLWLERIVSRFTDRIIAVSYFDKQKGLEKGIGDEKKYVLIRYGIDYGEFIPYQNSLYGKETGSSFLRNSENKSVLAGKKDCFIKERGCLRDEFGLVPGDLFVVNISCFKPQKSPQDFIELASLINKSMPNVKFLLAGDGILRPRIESLIKKFSLEGKVILSGWRRDIPGILSIADVFVLTSLWEGLPVSVLEALAVRCPIVATDTGGIREVVIEGKTGFLVSRRNTKEMFERVLMLLRDEKLRREIAGNTDNVLNFDFSLESMLRNTRDLYGSFFPHPLISPGGRYFG